MAKPKKTTRIQKTDSVWAPIFTLAIGNAFACVTLFVLHYIGILV